MAESIVQKKLAKLIQQELSDILPGTGVVPSGALLTVSTVRVTGDLSIAKVYISVFPDQHIQSVLEKLTLRDWEMRKALASRIRNKVRKIPEVRFYPDPSYKEAEEMINLLDNLKAQHNWDEDSE
ncbi:MAG: 30S ribosome-binding factor RbfA [Bacteroidota bacterium]